MSDRDLIAEVTPQARQFVADLESVQAAGWADLALLYARALSALRVVWASRRRMQDRTAELEAERDQLHGAIAAWHLHDRAQRARIAELENELGVFEGLSAEHEDGELDV